MLNADPTKVTKRAKKRGLPQLGTLGAGNHYAEIQIVEEIFDEKAAKKMGIDRKDQVSVQHVVRAVRNERAPRCEEPGGQSV